MAILNGTAALLGAGAASGYAFGPPLHLGNASSASATSLQIATAYDIAPGDTVLVLSTGNATTVPVWQIVDDAGNAVLNTVGGAGLRSLDFNLYVATASMAAGGNISISFRGAATAHAAVALLFKGVVLGFDGSVVGGAVGGSGVSTSRPWTALGSAVEYLIGYANFDVAPGTVTPAAGFATADQTTTNLFIYSCYRIAQSGAGSGSLTLSWINTANFKLQALAFQPAIPLLAGGATSASAAATLSARATLAGSGALAGTALTPQQFATAALAGAGVAAGSAVARMLASASLAGAGALACDTLHAPTAAAEMDGAGTLVCDSSHAPSAASELDGVGALACNALGTPPVSITLAGEGFIAGDSVHPVADAPTLAGAGTLVANARLALATAALLAGAGSLASDSVHASPALAVALAGAGTLACDSVHGAPATVVVLAGAGALACDTVHPPGATAALLTGTGTLAGDAVHRPPAAALLAGLGTLALDAAHQPLAAAQLAGAGRIVTTAIGLGPPLVLATGYSAVATQVLTTAYDIAVGDTVLILVSSGTVGTGLVTIADDGGNACSPHATDPGATAINIATYVATAPMAAGGHITLGFNGAGAAHIAIAYLWKGQALRPDAGPGRVSGTSSVLTTSTASGALVTDGEWAMGMVAFGAIQASFDPGPGFTQLGTNTVTRSGYGVYQLSPPVGGTTLNPSWTTAMNWGARLLTMMPAAAFLRGAGRLTCNATTTNVFTWTAGAALAGQGTLAAGIVLAPVLLGDATGYPVTSLAITTLRDINPGDTVAIFVAQNSGGALLGVSDSAGNTAPASASANAWVAGSAYYYPGVPMAAGGQLTVQFDPTTPTGHAAIAMLFRGLTLVPDATPPLANGTGTGVTISSGPLAGTPEYLVGFVSWTGTDPGGFNPGPFFTTLDMTTGTFCAACWSSIALMGSHDWSPSWPNPILFRSMLVSMMPAFAILNGTGRLTAMAGFAILQGTGNLACDARHVVGPVASPLAGAGALACDAQHAVLASALTLAGTGALAADSVHGASAGTALAGAGALGAYAFGPPLRLGNASGLGVIGLQIATQFDIAPGDTVLVLSTGNNVNVQPWQIVDDAGNAVLNAFGGGGLRNLDYNLYVATHALAAGGNITISFRGPGTAHAAVALLFRGLVLGFDGSVVGGAIGGSGISTSRPWNALGSAVEYLIGYADFDVAPGPVTPSAGFALADQTTTNLFIYSCYRIAPSGAGSGSLALSWINTANFKLQALAFQPAIPIAGSGALQANATVLNVKAQLAGSGALAVSAALVALSLAGLSGSGAVAVDAIHAAAGVAALAGAGSLRADASPFLSGGQILTGEGFLVADSQHLAFAQATLAGVGALLTSPGVPGQIYCGLAGEGFIAGNGVHLAAPAAALLAGAGSQAATAVQWEIATAALLGSGGLSAAAGFVFAAVASLAAVGGVAASAVASLIATGTLAGAGALAATSQRLVFAPVTALAGQGSLGAAGNGLLAASASLLGVSAVQAAAGAQRPALALLAGSGGLLALSQGRLIGQAILAGQGFLAAGAAAGSATGALLAGQGAIRVDAQAARFGAATLAGVGAVAAGAAVTQLAQASLAGAGGLVAGARRSASGAAILAGAGTLQVQSLRSPVAARATLAGVGTLQVGASKPAAGRTVLAGAGTIKYAWGFWVAQARATLAGQGFCRIDGMPAQFGAAALAGQGRVLADAIIEPWTGFCIGSDAALAAVSAAEDIFFEVIV